MARVLIILLLIAIVLAWWYLRKKRSVAPLESLETRTARWQSLLERDWPMWQRLPAEQRATLLDRLEHFLERVPFTGAHGLVVTEEMRVLVGAQACLITLGSDDYPFDDLHGVTMHRDEFVVEEAVEDEDTGVVTEGYQTLSGQAIESDRIVLSWKDVLESVRRQDGYNVVIHEFTHFLEHTRPGGDRAARVTLESCLAELRSAVDRGEQTLLDPYGAEDITEFLAVAAEFFFERSTELREQHPLLYVLLRDSFHLDPASWEAPVALPSQTEH